ncbi:MAG: hypothetical protein J2P58_12235 [Acidimicrobiaceae bacterium]|nr:hypothetical protein [Acidimicrobiaceae bacterium]MBO0747286.1 hypothetical protein [Acidimicrobiaceae bacterium]
MTKRRRSGASKKQVEARFWGQPLPGRSPASPSNESAPSAEPSDTPAGPAGIRPTPDPGALVRSLGPPPLAVDHAVSERVLTAVYEEAVRTATALAAANGLLAPDDPATADS